MVATILVTGFGPFPGVPNNPSARLAERVATARTFSRNGIATRALILTTSYAALAGELAPHLKQDPPDCILMLGVAAKRRRICVERRAANRVNGRAPDATGKCAGGMSLQVGAALPRMPRIPLLPLLRALTVPGVRPAFSRDAGRYLCNAAYFETLGAMRGRPVVFLHIPMPRVPGRLAARPDGRPTMDQMERALIRAARQLAVRSRWSRPERL